MTKDVPASVKETAFCCPHCGAFTTQFWFQVHYYGLDDGQKPDIWRPEEIDAFVEPIPKDKRGDVESLLQKMATGLPSLETKHEHNDWRSGRAIHNVWMSECFNCRRLAFWVYDRMIYPAMPGGPQPNEDLPEDIANDYREASSILGLSPRGAAALLRLCIQKLCIHLKLPGKSIDADIASLVRAGLDPRIQKALDAVRVTGNNAVHPGEMNVADDPAVALRLFSLVNVIAERMITVPKHIDATFEGLPDGAKVAIAKRDGSKPKSA